MNALDTARIRRRAAAMRMATLLSQVDFDAFVGIKGWAKADSYKQCKMSDDLTPIKFWPEINMDFFLNHDNEDYEIPTDDCRKGPAVWPIDCASAFRLDNENVRLSWVRTVRGPDVRGKVYRVSKYMVRAESCDVSVHGKLLGYGGNTYGLLNGQWTSLVDAVGAPRVGRWYNHDGATTVIPNIILGDALMRRYDWSAVFSFPGGLRLRFGCSARGALELFRNREKADGEARRRALLHWVRKHWRKSSTVEDMREVRKHLRGVVSFEWCGLPVSLLPAEYELEAA